jgi:hypothetical protein
MTNEAKRHNFVVNLRATKKIGRWYWYRSVMRQLVHVSPHTTHDEQQRVIQRKQTTNQQHLLTIHCYVRWCVVGTDQLYYWL